MTSLDEIKAAVSDSSDWVKIGEKIGSPALSIFGSDLKLELDCTEYVPGKNYFFDDGDYKFKITSKMVDNQQKFFIFIKNMEAITVPNKTVATSAKKKVFGQDMKVALIIASIFIAAGVIVILSGPISKALFG